MPVPRRTQRERKAESYQRLLEAAQKVLSEKGYAGGTIEDIVREAGYSQGAFYNHWSSKDQMVADLVQTVAQQQLEHLQHQSIESSHMFENLRANSGDPRLFFELWLLAVRGHGIASFLKEHYQSWRQKLAELILDKSDHAGYQTSGQDVMLKASMLMALFDGLLIQYQLDPEAFAGESFQQGFDRMVRKLVEA